MYELYWVKNYPGPGKTAIQTIDIDSASDSGTVVIGKVPSGLIKNLHMARFSFLNSGKNSLGRVNLPVYR